jgi:hypothetical protein
VQENITTPRVRPVVARSVTRAELRSVGEAMTARPARTGKRGSTGRSGGRTGRAGGSGSAAGTGLLPPSIFRRSTSHRSTTGKLGRWARPINAGPTKLPRRTAAMLARQQSGSAEARALRRLKQPTKVRMQTGGLGQRVRVIAGGMSQEQRNDYYAACEGKISWAQYRARWGHGPQPG